MGLKVIAWLVWKWAQSASPAIAGIISLGGTSYLAEILLNALPW
jgi:hypothetical protein